MREGQMVWDEGYNDRRPIRARQITVNVTYKSYCFPPAPSSFLPKGLFTNSISLAMAPVAIYTASPPADAPKTTALAQAKGSALVIGSLTTAQDGNYQRIVSELEATREVERQILDRLLDHGNALTLMLSERSSRLSAKATVLVPGSYASVHVSLSPADHDLLRPRLSELLSQLLDGLVPTGTLHILNLPASDAASLPSELTLAGFHVLTTTMPSDGTLIAQKPSHTAGASFSLKSKTASPSLTAALPRRSIASKKAIWDLSAPRGATIDAESLLTDADRARPAACEPIKPGGVRRKKACKGCTCGLAEEEEAELQQGLAKIVLLDGSETGNTSEVTLSEKERLLKAARAAPKATSSCGSCFLGDAFRCAGCPYLGLPAFNPGEKVEIDFGMDDI
ncbi:cytokine-induced anti-apoptosis inhibitor 1, Fe-S biogenesis-domain-containing protein [Gloeopeniophorella convolvens]|nr:cytokine-induced anti-apoptosis inhibitor 1, Fe-S biogenesis-domain-containing protein [Gloeopeniophorella convolvens]